MTGRADHSPPARGHDWLNQPSRIFPCIRSSGDAGFGFRLRWGAGPEEEGREEQRELSGPGSCR